MTATGPRSSVRTVLGGFVAGVFFFSNVLLAHAAENNMWAERQQRRRSSQAPQVAALPAPMAAPGQADLLRQIPALRRSLVSGPQPMKAAGNSDLPASIAPFFEAIPLNRATIRDMRLLPPSAAGAPAPLVVIVEDVHLNNEAQSNIAAVLTALCEKAGELMPGVPLAVGVEAAFGPFDFTPFHAFGDKAAVLAVADCFLKANKIAAPSYVGITSGRDLTGFFGVDDETHYNANVDAYRRAQSAMLPAAAALKAATASVTDAKRKALNPDLARLDGLRSAYQQGSVGMGDYLSSLARMGGRVQRDDATLGAVEPVVEQFVSAYRLETSLDFTRVERERSQVVEKLASKLSADELKGLLASGIAYRSGGLSFADFYRSIKALVDRHGIPLNQTPAFDQYIRYVLLADGIKAEALFAGVKRLENTLIAALSRTPEERDLMSRSRSLYLVGKLITFGLTPDEWSEYRAARDAAAFRDLPDLSAFESFYREADTRSESIVSNILLRVSKVPAGRTPVGVLVVGGFHAPEIAALLNGKGVSHAIVQPKITKVDGLAGNEYLTIFTQDKAPLDQLFSGTKLFLGVAATAAGSVSGPGSLTTGQMLGASAAAAALTGKSLEGSGYTASDAGNGVRRVRAPGGLTFFATLRAGAIRGYQAVTSLELPGIGNMQILTKRQVLGGLTVAAAFAAVAGAAGYVPAVRLFVAVGYVGMLVRNLRNAPADQRLGLAVKGGLIVALVLAVVVFGHSFGLENGSQMAAMGMVVLPSAPAATTAAARAPPERYPVTRVEKGSPNNEERRTLEEAVSDVRVRAQLRKMQKFAGLTPGNLKARTDAERKTILRSLWNDMADFEQISLLTQFNADREPSDDDLLRIATNGGKRFAGSATYSGAGISMGAGLPDWYELRLETVLSIMDSAADKLGMPSTYRDRIRIIFKDNWKISPERTFSTLYNFMGPEMYGAMVALETGRPDVSHLAVANKFFNGTEDHHVTLNFDTLIERAAYSLGMWEVLPGSDARDGTVKIQAYNGDGEAIGAAVTVNAADIDNGVANVAGTNVHLFYVNDMTSTPGELLDGLSNLGVPILHKPHGSSKPGRKDTIIADFEGTGQTAFPEAYRKYLLKILMNNYVTVFGVSMRDPDHSGMVRYLVSMLTYIDASDEELAKLSADQRKVVAEMREIRAAEKELPDGRGVHFIVHLGRNGPDKSYTDQQKASVRDFAQSGTARVTVAVTTEAMDAMAGTKTPQVNAPVKPPAARDGWKRSIVDFFSGLSTTPTQVRAWMYASLLATQEADPSGRHERVARASAAYAELAKDPVKLRAMLREIALTPTKEISALYDVVDNPAPGLKPESTSKDQKERDAQNKWQPGDALPATLEILLNSIPEGQRTPVVNGLFRLDWVFEGRHESAADRDPYAGREGLYKEMLDKGLIEQWQYYSLMGVSRQDRLDTRGAHAAFGRAAETVRGYTFAVALGQDATTGISARRAFFSDPVKFAEFFAGWSVQEQKLLSLTAQFRMHRDITELELPNSNLLAEARAELDTFRQIFEKARAENPTLFDFGSQRAGERSIAATEEAFLYMDFFDKNFALEGFQRDNKKGTAAVDGVLPEGLREEFERLLTLPDETRAETQARYGGELAAYYAALAAGQERASFGLFVRMKNRFLAEQVARMTTTGGKGGNFLYLLEVYVQLMETSTVSNDLKTGGEWLKEAEQLKAMLTLGEDHWVVRKLAAEKAYYLLKVAGTTDPDLADRKADALKQLLGMEPLIRRFERAKDRSVWLKLKEVAAIANFMKFDFKLTKENESSVLAPFTDIMLWFAQQQQPLRNAELNGMIHVMSDFFDFMVMNGFTDYNQIYPGFAERVAQLWNADLNIDEAVRSVGIPRPNALTAQAFFRHMQALNDPSATARATYRQMAIALYTEAKDRDSNPERKTRHALRLVQFYSDVAPGLKASADAQERRQGQEYEAAARKILNEIPGILKDDDKTIEKTPDGGLRPTNDGRLAVKYEKLRAKFPEPTPSLARLTGALALTTPRTMAAGRTFFRNLLGFGVPDIVVRVLYAVPVETLKFFFDRTFQDQHFAPGGFADTARNRAIVGAGIAAVRVATLAGLLAGIAVSLIQGHPALLLALAPLFALGANWATHGALNIGLAVSQAVAQRRSDRRVLTVSSSVRGLVALPAFRAQSQSDRTAQVAQALNGLFVVTPLGVGTRTLRDRELAGLVDEISRGENLNANLALLSVLAGKDEKDFTSTEDAVRMPADAPGRSLIVQTYDAKDKDVASSVKALRDRMSVEDTAVVYAPADRIEALITIAAGRNIRFEVYTPGLDIEALVNAEAGAGSLSRVKVMLSKNAVLSPEALQKLASLESSGKFNLTIYMILAAVSVPITTRDLENITRVARLVAIQA